MPPRSGSLLHNSPLSGLVLGAFMVATIWVVFNVRRWNHREVLQWDTDGYYLYLPATLIHHDLLHMRFLDSIPPGRYPAGYRFGQGSYRVERTGLISNKYTMGVALSELPFFLVAHGWCTWSSPEEANGYSPPYHLSVALASAFWAGLGLLVLTRFLRRHVPDVHAAIAVAGLGFGTNLFFYSSFAGGMSHPFLFFLCAQLVDRTDRWYARPSVRDALIIGICLGLAVLTRPTSGLMVIVPLCWQLRYGGLQFLRAHIMHLATALVAGVVCVLPQMLLWKLSTGSFIHYSYGAEGFDFTHPHFLEGLFGFRKGWFVYTPLALLAALSAIFLRMNTLSSYPIMLAAFFIPFVYVIFCWDPWWYGGGFGSRPMIDVLPLLALPLALAVQRLLNARSASRWAALLSLAACITLNLFQQWQYQRGIIHHEAMTFERWCQVFGKTTTAGLPVFP